MSFQPSVMGTKSRRSLVPGSRALVVGLEEPVGVVDGHRPERVDGYLSHLDAVAADGKARFDAGVDGLRMIVWASTGVG